MRFFMLHAQFWHLMDCIKKHSGVISNFQMRYIKNGIFDKQLSNIIKSVFSLRIESDYEDFYVIAKADVENQVEETDIFYQAISEYLHENSG